MMWSDFKYALRLLLKAPVFTVLTIIVMTCGLAISIYMYSLLNTLVFKPLPFADSENVVVLDKVSAGSRKLGQLNAADLLSIEAKNKSFDKLNFFYFYNRNIRIDKISRRYLTVGIEPGGIEFTQVKPLLGRTFDPKDAQSYFKTIISYDLWGARFNKNEDVIGQFIEIDNSKYAIIGVMPKGFSFPMAAELWLPISRTAGMSRGTNWTLAAFTKLKKGVSLVAANKDLNNIMGSLAETYPDSNYGVSAYAETFQKQVLGKTLMSAVWALSGTTVFVLLLACANVYGLLLSKAFERANETAVRCALGAPRYRVIMQMIWESTIICVVSGLFALALVSWALQLTTPIFEQMSFEKPLYWLVFGLDRNTVIAAVIVVVFSIFIAGFLPAWKVTGGDFNALLRQGSRGATNARVGRLNKILLTAEVALSTLVLIVAAMLIINSEQSTRLNAGYDKQKLLTFSLQFSYADHYGSTKRRSSYLQKLEQQLEAIPEINNVSYASASPGGEAWATQIIPHDNSYRLENVYANAVFINSDYFEQANIKLVAGRLINLDDTIKSKKVAVISSSVAKRLWSNEDALGKFFTIPEIVGAERIQVVGIVPHISHGAAFYAASNYGGIYLANTQFNYEFQQITVDYTGSSETLISKIDAVMSKLDRNIPPFMIMSYESLLATYMSGILFLSKLFSVLAFIVLILTTSGIYGVTANSIYQRLREIGIRRALGASNLQMLCYFLKQACMQLIIGLSIGLLLGASVCYWLLPQFLVSSTIMLVIFASIITIIILVVMFAVFSPLKRILKFEPAYALRSE